MLVQVMNCRIEALPIIYLGLSLGVVNNDLGVWNPVAEKRPVGWQKRYLSKGRKDVLIKSTLLSISTYCMSLFDAPSVVGKLEIL